MGVSEEHAARGQPIEIRRDRLGVPAETADPVVEIVHRNEEDIGLVRCGCRNDEPGNGQKEKGTLSKGRHRRNGYTELCPEPIPNSRSSVTTEERITIVKLQVEE